MMRQLLYKISFYSAKADKHMLISYRTLEILSYVFHSAGPTTFTQLTRAVKGMGYTGFTHLNNLFQTAYAISRSIPILCAISTKTE